MQVGYAAPARAAKSVPISVLVLHPSNPQNPAKTAPRPPQSPPRNHSKDRSFLRHRPRLGMGMVLAPPLWLMVNVVAAGIPSEDAGPPEADGRGICKASTTPIGNRSSILCDASSGRQRLPRLRWLHIAKTGTSFANVLFHYVCVHAEPHTSVAPTAYPAWPPAGLRRAYEDPQSTCNHSIILNGQEEHVHFPPVYPRDAGLVVTVLRRPAARMFSCLSFISMRFSCNPTRCDATRFLPYHLGLGQLESTFCERYHGNNCSLPLRWLFSDAVRPRIQAIQTKMLLGYELDAAPSLSALPALASIRLGALAFVALTEAWEASVCLFHATFGGTPQPGEFSHAHQRGPPNSKAEVALALAIRAYVDQYVDVVDEKLYVLASLAFEADLSRSPCAHLGSTSSR